MAAAAAVQKCSDAAALLQCRDVGCSAGRRGGVWPTCRLRSRAQPRTVKSPPLPHKTFAGEVLPPGGKVVVFSQIRECSSIIESWVRHYAALGFFKLLLYLDDPEDISGRVLEEGGWVEAGFVELTKVDARVKASWPEMPSWGRIGRHCEMEVQSRQILNNEHALLRARELDADWMLHVDSDELICLETSAPEYFADLTKRGCTMYTMTNVEGVPEQADSYDVLQSVRVFRQNMGRVPRNPKAGAAFFHWQLRLGGWFISYENGKSAVSVKHAVRCLSVCMWEVKGQLEAGKTKQPDGSTCTWYTNNRLLFDAAVARRREGRLAEEEEVPRFDDRDLPMLLHFCVCDFASFWRKRWTQLGYLSASDQFRVRASSGAMMSRFYRLQQENLQSEARDLYEMMCVSSERKVLESHLDSGVQFRHDPKGKTNWPKSPKPVPYETLARQSTEAGRHIDAWQLWGKAIENACEEAPVDEWLALRAQSAMEAGLAACALSDLEAACLHRRRQNRSHEEPFPALWLRVAALRKLGRTSTAAQVLSGIAKENRKLYSKCEQQQIETMLLTLKNESSSSATSTLNAKALPTPAELQGHVVKAIRPDPKDSRLYMAVLPVAMSWWQETGGDLKEFSNALARTAISARSELAAVDASVRPRPIAAVREVWDSRPDQLREDATSYFDLKQLPPEFISSVSKHALGMLGAAKSVTVKDCNQEGHPLGMMWAILGALCAEVSRAFAITELRVVTELALSRIDPAIGEKVAGAVVDNGGLLPDNRREVSLRTLIPLESESSNVAPSQLLFKAKDGEKEMSFEVRPDRIFVFWSRSTLYQCLPSCALLSISAWGVVQQKVDKR